MVVRAERELDVVLDAIANPHRREIVRLLGLQPYAIHQLADIRGLSLPAINKHLKILETAGLVVRRKHGRTTYLTLRREPLAALQNWVTQFHPYWGSDHASHENYLTFLTQPGAPGRTEPAPDPEAELHRHGGSP